MAFKLSWRSFFCRGRPTVPKSALSADYPHEKHRLAEDESGIAIEASAHKKLE